MHLVWFKKDLRLFDHQALHDGLQHGPVILLYIIEPEQWAQKDASYRQYQHLRQCLDDLSAQINKRGASLTIRYGDACDVLKELCQKHQVTDVCSHQETGNYWSYQRDKKVNKMLQQLKVAWHQPRQNGVVRALADRQMWERQWYDWVAQPLLAEPDRIEALELTSDPLPEPSVLGLEFDGIEQALIGGRSAGLQRLQSFLNERGLHYTKDMSSPLTAFQACSRLSVDFAFGTISLREAYQQAQQSYRRLSERPAEQRGYWRQSLGSFMRRLRWHCHFIQKLESQPDIEFQSYHSAYRALWPIPDTQSEALKRKAWERGETGYPFVDACMRALMKTGWINFRMRAMLMSFASHHLWLCWQDSAHYLAKLFVDYEPGIHYSQVQMQSGSTGMNIIRLYNPIKQGLEHDPEGVFIKKWVPELSGLSGAALHQPWEYHPHSLPNYPPPIVDEKGARTTAASRLYGVKKSWPETLELVRKHSRGNNYKKDDC